MTAVAAYRFSHLDALEAESIFIMREVVAEFERPVLLFSGGKDSIVMLRLAEKAFWPAPIPFPVMHVDTGHNFDEVLAYRDRRVAELGLNLIVASVPEALVSGLVREPADGTRNRIQTPVLLGRGREAPLRRPLRRRPARRGEGPGQGAGVQLPRRVRPVGSAQPAAGAVVRSTTRGSTPASRSGSSRCPTGPSSTCGTTSPASRSPLPSIYFAHEREVVDRDGMLYAVHEHLPVRAGEEPFVGGCATGPWATRAARPR